jgi:hypothetical protein
MIKVFNILSRTFCLLLMIHLLAVSVCDDYLLKLINKSNIEQTLDIEKDTDNDSKEFDDFDDEYLVNSPHNFIYNYSDYLQIALSQRIEEILIPPPRA